MEKISVLRAEKSEKNMTFFTLGRQGFLEGRRQRLAAQKTETRIPVRRGQERDILPGRRHVDHHVGGVPDLQGTVAEQDGREREAVVRGIPVHRSV